MKHKRDVMSRRNHEVFLITSVLNMARQLHMSKYRAASIAGCWMYRLGNRVHQRRDPYTGAGSKEHK
jgi:hypothetical protein